jgi:hypothetical protein
MSEHEARVKAVWPDAELGYRKWGVRIVVKRRDQNLKWFEGKHLNLSASFYTASEAWEDAAIRLDRGGKESER